MEIINKNKNVIYLIIFASIILIIFLIYRLNNKFYELFDTTNLQSGIDSGYNKFNEYRFGIMDNQFRLDKINKRINKILDNVSILRENINKNTKQNILQKELVFY
jgi:hypothetical protein